MNLHEFQAKEILREFDIATPAGGVAGSTKEAMAIARGLDCEGFAVKAQVHSGGRGSAGGVQIVDSADAVAAAAKNLLGSRLVTDQMGAQVGPLGRQVSRVYVECAVDVASEVYLAVLVDRTAGAIALIGSKEGSTNIEQRWAEDETLLEKIIVEDASSPDSGDLAGFVRRLGFEDAAAANAAALCKQLCRALIDLDASLIEINPLALTKSGELLALDVKMIIDDNALFRQPKLAALRDEDELDPVEFEAQRHEINLLQMDGNIGVIVNGAGLALATLDMLRDVGGNPANFMDIRTTAKSQQIAEGIILVLANARVKALLLNIHGGGLTRCDTIAEGMGIAFRRAGRSVPVVFRAAGNNADMARLVLKNCGIAFHDTKSMSEAVSQVVAVVKGGMA